VPIGERGPGASYRADDGVPSVHSFHQPGVTTPVLDHLAFAALDLATDRRDALRVLMRDLTATAQGLMGQHAGQRRGGAEASLTVTLGLGPGVFDACRGPMRRRPVALAPLPAFRRR
jgi:deferrochelatase/peroxidase EfeB